MERQASKKKARQAVIETKCGACSACSSTDALARRDVAVLCNTRRAIVHASEYRSHLLRRSRAIRRPVAITPQSGAEMAAVVEARAGHGPKDGSLVPSSHSSAIAVPLELVGFIDGRVRAVLLPPPVPCAQAVNAQMNTIISGLSPVERQPDLLSRSPRKSHVACAELPGRQAGACQRMTRRPGELARSPSLHEEP